MTNRQNTLLLLIFDDSGIRIQNDYNPFTPAKMPRSDSYLQNHPHAELDYFAICLGLPACKWLLQKSSIHTND